MHGKRLTAFSGLSDPPPAGYAEQDERLAAGLFTALQTFALTDISGLRGIGLLAGVHVFVGGDGTLLPAITWQDTRAAEDAAALDAGVTAEEDRLARRPRPHRCEPRWHGWPGYAALTPALRKTRHVLLPKDYLVMALTGAVGSDAIAAVGLANAQGYVPQLLDLVPGAAERLPQLYPFTHVMGRVGENLPCAGAPVVVGAMDAWGGMFAWVS